MKVKLYYSVSNGGDGSAYPMFFLRQSDAEKHQEGEEEWGEPCVGSIEVDVKEDGTYSIPLQSVGHTESYENIFPESGDGVVVDLKEEEISYEHDGEQRTYIRTTGTMTRVLDV